jgi:uncharacterized protein involved in outer membrane biogenesis
MKRALFVLFSVIAAITVIGLLVAFTRPINWPENVRPLALRRVLGELRETSAEREEMAA